MNASRTNFQDKYRRAYRGEWLYSFGSSFLPEVRSAGRRPGAVGQLGASAQG